MLQIIAIDGISGSGKSSTSHFLAKALGFRHLDTGAMYRMLTYAALQKGIRPDQHAELGKVAEGLSFSFDADGELLSNGKSLPQAIRDQEVSAAVSEYCQPREVREVLVRRQRELAQARPTVVEGRDIGTVVFPDAPWKFYLTAKPEVRAQRRVAELAATGLNASYETILQNLRERDEKDSSRTHSPLKKAADAMVVDTSGLTLEAQVAMLCTLVKKGSPR